MKVNRFFDTSLARVGGRVVFLPPRLITTQSITISDQLASGDAQHRQPPALLLLLLLLWALAIYSPLNGSPVLVNRGGGKPCAD